MRLIDGDALIEKKFPDREISGCGEGVAYRCGWNDAIEAICENEPTIKTKEIKYFDEDEKVWKIGRVIVDETD